MKDKEKQIEEIKQIINERCEAELEQVHASSKGGKVIKTVDTILIAKDIYNANYRKLPENSRVFIPDGQMVLLSKEEYSDYLILQKNHEFIREKAKKLQADNERLYKNIGKFKEIVRKETAEKILKWLKEHCDFAGFVIVETYFKEEFGVE